MAMRAGERSWGSAHPCMRVVLPDAHSAFVIYNSSNGSQQPVWCVLFVAHQYNDMRQWNKFSLLLWVSQ